MATLSPDNPLERSEPESQSKIQRHADSAVAPAARQASQTVAAAASPARQSRLEVQAAMFAGPLPPPEVLQAYETVAPGMADRIVRMAEEQSAHRRNLEAKVVDREFSEARLGQVLAFLICVTAFGLGSYTALNGHEWAGSILGIGGVSGIVSTFVLGRRNSVPEDRTESARHPKSTNSTKRRK